MKNLIDTTRPPRADEQLELSRLEPYLRGEFPDLTGEIVIEQFPSGHSNLTYLVRMGEKEFVLRRPPFGSKVKTAHDMGREFRVLSPLSKVYVPAPAPVAFCDDESVLGAPFYLMERVKGVVLRQTPPDGLSVPTEVVTKMCESFIDNLADLHAVDYQAAGLGELGRPQGYVERQVTGWAKRYSGSQTDDIPDVDRIVKWLREQMPPESGASLIHNDYKFDNIALDPADLTRIIGVFDWEMSTVGDPLMDLGTALGYWVQSGDTEGLITVRSFITTMPGSMTRRQLADRYAQRTGRDLSRMIFYYVFALFKLAVIIQQIYYRYAQGLTKDERFAHMNEGVRSIIKAGVQAMETGEF